MVWLRVKLLSKSSVSSNSEKSRELAMTFRVTVSVADTAELTVELSAKVSVSALFMVSVVLPSEMSKVYAPPVIAASRSSNTSWTLSEPELSNSSKVPTKDAPEVAGPSPVSLRPMEPIVRSPPASIVRLTTSETVPEEMSMPLIVSSVAAVIEPEAAMVVTPEMAPAPEIVQVPFERASEAPSDTELAEPLSMVTAESFEEMLPLFIWSVSPEATIRFPDEESRVRSWLAADERVTAPVPV